jgi:hypothetical protein
VHEGGDPGDVANGDVFGDQNHGGQGNEWCGTDWIRSGGSTSLAAQRWVEQYLIQGRAHARNIDSKHRSVDSIIARSQRK